MNSSYFANKKLKGRDVSAAPRINNRNKSMNIKIVQKGRSMIEMLGVLAIIGVLSVGGIAGYSKAMMKYRINKTIEQISLIAGNVRTFFGTQKNFSDLGSWSSPNITVMKKAKLIPDEMWNGDDIVSAFGTKVRVAGYGDNIFSINIANLPVEAIIALSSYDWFSNNNIDSMVICGSDWERGSNALHSLDYGVNIDEVLEECVTDEPIYYSDLAFALNFKK